MPENLTERQKALARWIAESIQTGKLDESFHAVWGTGLSPNQYPILIWREGDWTIPEFTYAEFIALKEDNLLRMAHDGGHAFPKGVEGYAPTDRHFSCTVTNPLMTTYTTASGKKSGELGTRTLSSLDVFISHSGIDSDLAEALVDLLRAAINIPHERIRCTSVDGYRLAAGALTDERLKQEVRSAICFIALLTPASLKSAYVLFELGARWGAELPFLPLLARGITGHSLSSPLSGLNALSCSSASQIHQFLTDSAAVLQLPANNPATYEKYLRRLMQLSEVAVSGNQGPSASSQREMQETVALSQAAEELLQLINGESDPKSKGIVVIRQEIQPGIIHFFPRLDYAGKPLAFKAREFRDALKELVSRGLLHQPELNESTNTVTYEFRGGEGQSN